MRSVFISYDRESRALAETLAKDIGMLGRAVWFDEELSGGQRWWDRILEQIRGCDVFVSVLTPRSLDSTACRREYEYAAALGKPVLPVVVAEGISTNLLPPPLALIQFVDYRSRGPDAALRLAGALAALPPTRPLPDPLPEPPEVPTSYLGGLAQRLAAAATLSHDDQSALLFDLRGSLRDPETAKDGRSLLKQFRKRRDLLASIAFEIDELLQPATPAPRREAAREEPPVPIAVAAAHVVTPVPSPRVPGPTPRERLLAAVIGAILGTIVGVSAMSTIRQSEWPFGFVTGVGAAVAGAIGGKRRTVTVTASIVAVVGWLVAWVAASPGEGAFAVGGVFAAPLGAILGAIIGVILVRRRRPA